MCYYIVDMSDTDLHVFSDPIKSMYVCMSARWNDLFLFSLATTVVSAYSYSEYTKFARHLFIWAHHAKELDAGRCMCSS